MSTPLDKENLRPILNKIMRTHQLKPESIPTNKAKRDIYSTGSFHCACGRTWNSAFSWITFDLKLLEIVKRWKMLCMDCAGECEPKFSVEELERMFEIAVSSYLNKGENRPINIGYRGRRDSTQPHRPDLCEKCGWGATLCWRFYSQYF